VDKKILINAKLKSGKKSKMQNKNWEKSIKEAKVCTEL
jgi:hypothetical protein